MWFRLGIWGMKGMIICAEKGKCSLCKMEENEIQVA
jgi:hypothetical protein